MRREKLLMGSVLVRILMAARRLPFVPERLPVVKLGPAPLLRQNLCEGVKTGLFKQLSNECASYPALPALLTVENHHLERDDAYVSTFPNRDRTQEFTEEENQNFSLLFSAQEYLSTRRRLARGRGLGHPREVGPQVPPTPRGQIILGEQHMGAGKALPWQFCEKSS